MVLKLPERVSQWLGALPCGGSVGMHFTPGSPLSSGLASSRGEVFPFTPQWECREKPHVVRAELWASLQLSNSNLSSTVKADSCFSWGFMEWGNWLAFRCCVAHKNSSHHNLEMIASTGSAPGMSSVWEPRCGLRGREPLSREGHSPWLSLNSLSLSLSVSLCFRLLPSFPLPKPPSLWLHVYKLRDLLLACCIWERIVSCPSGNPSWVFFLIILL